MKILKTLFVILAFAMVACDKNEFPTYIPDNDNDVLIPSLGTPSDYEIWFTTTNDKELISFNPSAFDVEVEEVVYSEIDYHIIRFKDRVTKIGEEAFANCFNLYNISLPHSITTIGKQAFYECKGIEGLTLGAGIVSCDTQAFDNCINILSLHVPSLKSWCAIEFADRSANPAYFSQSFLVNGTTVKSASIPNGVKSIGSFAFYDNKFITEITIPASVERVGKKAFVGCEYITKVSAEDVNAWCGIDFEDIDSNPLAIAGCKFYSGDALVTDLSLIAVEEIKPHTFYSCNSLQLLTVDDATSVIGAEAFRACSELASVTLGSGITSIGEKAFMSCKELKKIVCYATTPPQLADDLVFDYHAEERKIYVPSESLDAYKNHKAWSRYADSIEAIE